MNEEFINELKNLIGERSIRQTSIDTNVSASYITGILKGKYIPSADILKRLTIKARNGVTIDILMKSAGYITEEISKCNKCKHNDNRFYKSQCINCVWNIKVDNFEAK